MGYWSNLAQAVSGGLGGQRKDPLVATLAAMKDAEAFVDPSKMMATAAMTPYNPSVLVTRKGLSVFDTMKRDEQVKACLAFKKAAMLSSGWEVVSPGDQDEDWEVTRFVRDTFEQFPGGWHAALKKMLLAIDYGYSVTEKVYGEAAWAEGKVVLLKLNSAKPHYFDFDASPTGELLTVIQRYVPGKALLEFPPDKFVIYVHDKEFENHYGRSELEAAYRPWWVKDNAYKWFAVYLERYGMAPLFALYDANIYQGPQVAELKKVVRNLQNATMGVIPRGEPKSLEFWSQQLSAASKEIFLAAFERFDADIGRALLTPALIGATSEDSSAGGGQRGSYARAQTHFNLFMTVIGDQQSSLCSDAVNSQVIPQLCDLNFPGLKSYPQMRMLPFGDDKKLELYRLWSELVAGKVVNQIEDDETHIRKALGFPENEAPELPGLAAEQAPGPTDAGKPEEVPEKEQTAEMRAFAEEHDAVWLRVGDERVAVNATEWAMESFFADEDGVWRTVNGMHIFIRSGESFDDALKRSLDADKNNPWPRNKDGGRELPGAGHKIPPPPTEKIPSKDKTKEGKQPHGLVTDLVRRFPNREALSNYLSKLPNDKLNTALKAIKNDTHEDSKYVRELIREVLKS